MASEPANSKILSTSSLSEEDIKAVSRKASAFAEHLVKREVGHDTLAEVVGHQSQWSEFRWIFEQNMRVWDDYSMVTLAVGAEGSATGWLVERRKANCGRQFFPDSAVEKRARTIPQIHADFQLQGVRRVAIDAERSMAVASFASPDKSTTFEVFVNHTMGEIIGFLPIPTGTVAVVPSDDSEAKRADELAWQQIEAGVAFRAGPEAAKQARQAFKLVPVSAARDSAGRCIRIYRLWQFFSAVDVSIEETKKEVIGWHIEALQAKAPERRINEAAAIQAAGSELKASDGVQGPDVTFNKVGDAEKATVHWWHGEEGINVEGDQTTVFVNATTGKVFSVARKWRKIPREVVKPPVISQEQALQAADRAIKRDPAQSRGHVIGKNIIEVSADPTKPGPVRDVLVWRVGYSDSGGIGFTEVSIDCQTGGVARITGW